MCFCDSIHLMHTITTTVLLGRLHDREDQVVWEEFDSRYRPILIGVGMSLGLNIVEAEEAAQESLVQFLRDYRDHKYKPENGRLRAWMIGICRNRVMDVHRRGQRMKGARGDSIIAHFPDEAAMTQAWDMEQQRVVFRRAMQRLLSDGKINERTTKVFEQVAIRNVPAQSVSDEHGIDIAEVYRIKNRVTKRLRVIVDELTCAYQDGM